MLEFQPDRQHCHSRTRTEDDVELSLELTCNRKNICVPPPCSAELRGSRGFACNDAKIKGLYRCVRVRIIHLTTPIRVACMVETTITQLHRLYCTVAAAAEVAVA